MLTDTHCHLFKEYFSDLDKVIKDANDVGVMRFISASDNLKSIDEMIDLSYKYDNVYIAIGIHPENCEEDLSEFEKILEDNKLNKKIVAIGEIGLDYYYGKETRDRQLEVFDYQLSLAEKYNLPVIEDLGSGVFIDLSKYGLSYEPTVLDSLKNGADIVTFSGDKMLGGPQAGIIVGKKEYIDKMKKNQLTRALRVDKLTICALEATLRMYLDEEKAIKEIPTLRMLTYKISELEEKAKCLYDKIIYT